MGSTPVFTDPAAGANGQLVGVDGLVPALLAHHQHRGAPTGHPLVGAGLVPALCPYKSWRFLRRQVEALVQVAPELAGSIPGVAELAQDAGINLPDPLPGDRPGQAGRDGRGGEVARQPRGRGCNCRRASEACWGLATIGRIQCVGDPIWNCSLLAYPAQRLKSRAT